jgi:hypothetical protein
VWVSITFAAVALAGAGFMVYFLLALHRESTRPHDCWIIPASSLNVTAVADCAEKHAAGEYYEEFKHRDSYVDLLESELYAKESCGLITLAIRSGGGHVDPCPKLPRRFGAHQRWFFL